MDSWQSLRIFVNIYKKYQMLFTEQMYVVAFCVYKTVI